MRARGGSPRRRASAASAAAWQRSTQRRRAGSARGRGRGGRCGGPAPRRRAAGGAARLGRGPAQDAPTPRPRGPRPLPPARARASVGRQRPLRLCSTSARRRLALPPAQDLGGRGRRCGPSASAAASSASNALGGGVERERRAARRRGRRRPPRATASGHVASVATLHGPLGDPAGPRSPARYPGRPLPSAETRAMARGRERPAVSDAPRGHGGRSDSGVRRVCVHGTDDPFGLECVVRSGPKCRCFTERVRSDT